MCSWYVSQQFPINSKFLIGPYNIISLLYTYFLDAASFPCHHTWLVVVNQLEHVLVRQDVVSGDCVVTYHMPVSWQINYE